MNKLLNPSRWGRNPLFVRHSACLLLLLGSAGAYADITVSTTALQVVFNTSNASMTVTDLANSDTWTQEVPTGSQAFTVVSSQQISARRFIATVQAPNSKQYSIDVKLDNSTPSPKPSFHVTLTPPYQNPDPNYP